MQRITKGEWVAVNQTGTGIYKILTKDYNIDICETRMPYSLEYSRPEVFIQGEANARLISAAPDLLASCLECLEIIDRTPNACGLSEEDINAMPHVKRLRDAIKKAEIQNVKPKNGLMCGEGAI